MVGVGKDEGDAICAVHLAGEEAEFAGSVEVGGEGEVFGFLGPNGAGKTTTVRMLCCLISKTSGSATVGGYQIGNDDTDSLKIRKLIGVVPAEGHGLFEPDKHAKVTCTSSCEMRPRQ